MEEGLLTLIFIVFMVVASILDAVGRRRKKQRRMEEMEGADDQGVEASPGMEGRPTASTGTDTESWRTESDSRETAETMVPEDFWAVLTGQELETRPPPEPETSGRAEPAGPGSYGEDGREEARPGDLFGRDDLGRRGDPDPPKEPRIPAPVPDDRFSTDEYSRPGGSADSGPQWGKARQEPQETGAIGDEEDRVYAQPPEPWGDLTDISSGDLSDDPEGQVLATGAPGAPGRPSARRRGAGRGRYSRLLETGDIEDLRKAVVLREILDRPVGFRDDVGPDW